MAKTADSSYVTEQGTEPADSRGLPRRVSPAEHLHDQFVAAGVLGDRAVSIRELPFCTMVGLRLTSGSLPAQRVEETLGAPLPYRCGAVHDLNNGGPGAVLWLSPDEFLVFTESSHGATVTNLVDAIADGPGSAIDLSANRTTLELSGPSARYVLNKGCPLDLHPRRWPVGDAYVTVIGAVAVIVWRSDYDTYRILVRSSFTDYLGRWLMDAMSEFSAPVLP